MEAPENDVNAVGMAGQLYTSFSQTASLFNELHWPALYPPEDQCQHSLVSGKIEAVSQELCEIELLPLKPVLEPLV